MRTLRITASCVTAVAALAAMSLAAGDNVLAAKRQRVAVNQPVCGLRADGPRTYDNSYAARRDHARVMHPGGCEPIMCWSWMGLLRSEPICGVNPLTHVRMTYPNKCAAEHAQATWLHDGACGGRR
jgi:hypothetical protein